MLQLMIYMVQEWKLVPTQSHYAQYVFFKRRFYLLTLDIKKGGIKDFIHLLAYTWISVLATQFIFQNTITRPNSMESKLEDKLEI